MSDLPDVVAEAGLLFQRTSVLNDDLAMKRIIDWGHAQIDSSYPDDPIRAPLNVLRRTWAHMQWDRVIRTQGRELRGTIASSMVRELEFEIQRRQTNILERDREGRRQQAVTFDTRTRIQEFDLTEQIRLRNDKERMDHAHHLSQEAEDNASRRRSRELVVAADQEVMRMVMEAVLAASQHSTTEATMNLITRINAEVTQIRTSTVLSDDDKHIQIKTWLDAIPTLLRQARNHE